MDLDEDKNRSDMKKILIVGGVNMKINELIIELLKVPLNVNIDYLEAVPFYPTIKKSKFNSNKWKNWKGEL